MKSSCGNFLAGLLMMASLGVLAGCVSTPVSRVESNATVVASWSPEVQAQVRAGKVAVGFTAEQVRVALGNPDEMRTQTTAEGSREIWIYGDHAPKFSFGFGVGGGGAGASGGVGVSTGGRRPREVLRVIFEGGAVAALEQTKRAGAGSR